MIREKFKLLNDITKTASNFERTPNNFEKIRKQTKNEKYQTKENKKLMMIFFEIDLFITDYINFQKRMPNVQTTVIKKDIIKGKKDDLLLLKGKIDEVRLAIAVGDSNRFRLKLKNNLIFLKECSQRLYQRMKGRF